MTKSICNTVPTITTWRGMNIEEMPREILIDVVRELGREVEHQRESHEQTFRMWEMCRKTDRLRIHY